MMATATTKTEMTMAKEVRRDRSLTVLAVLLHPWRLRRFVRALRTRVPRRVDGHS